MRCSLSSRGSSRARTSPPETLSRATGARRQMSTVRRVVPFPVPPQKPCNQPSRHSGQTHPREILRHRPTKKGTGLNPDRHGRHDREEERQCKLNRTRGRRCVLHKRNGTFETAWWCPRKTGFGLTLCPFASPSGSCRFLRLPADGRRRSPTRSQTSSTYPGRSASAGRHMSK